MVGRETYGIGAQCALYSTAGQASSGTRTQDL